MTKQEIDALVDALLVSPDDRLCVRFGGEDGEIVPRETVRRDLYVANGLTATGAEQPKKPELVRAILYKGNWDGYVRLMPEANLQPDDNLTIIAWGTFVPDGVGVEMVEYRGHYTSASFYIGAPHFNEKFANDVISRGRYIRGLK